MRYFIYCRKSSENEDRQVASIESQLTTLQRAFADKPDTEIVHIYEEAFSAKAPGRSQFGEMLSRIEKGHADGIIAWAPDRLARNSIDGGRIIYMLDRKLIRDLKFATYTFENNSQGKFMLQIMFGQSKYYSDALSDNVKRGNQTKVEKGWRPGKAPIGYRNDIINHTIVKDLERFPLVRRMFDLMLTGSYPPRRIWQIARNDWALKTPTSKRIGGKLIVLSSVYKILTCPFYAGLLVWNGKTYPGAHVPVVSIEEFERVQTLLGLRDKPRPHKRAFAFTGMIRCGECGLLVTAEEKTNRFGSHYTYYHCTRRKAENQCHQPSITTQKLEDQILAFLTTITIPRKLESWAQKQLRTTQNDDEDIAQVRQKSVQSAIDETERGLANVTSLRIRDMIGDEEFVRERRKLEQELLRLQRSVRDGGQLDQSFEPLDALISFRVKALDWFCTGDVEAKRLIFNSVSSNPTLKDKTLSVKAKKPFYQISHRATFPKLRAIREDVRTLYTNRDTELLDILHNIRRLEIKFGIRSAEDHRAA